MNALEKIIHQHIAAHGPISVTTFMQFCLQHPEYGYYRKNSVLGTKGDFITAPEISQIFGELLGVWVAEYWRLIGRPKEFIWLELGPGRGTLMADALRATQRLNDFHAAARIYMVESNPTLRAAQMLALKGRQITYCEDIKNLPSMPLIFIANEFFDALPLRQFINTPQGWRENKIKIAAEGGLSFTLTEKDIFSPVVAMLPDDAGKVVEVSQDQRRWMRRLAQHICTFGGGGLVVDYGYVEKSWQSTLQAVRAHQKVDFFSEIGETDLTALVDFKALKAVACSAGLGTSGPLGQGEFLKNMGLELRLHQLQQRATAQQAAELASGAARLVGESAMGRLFKVLSVHNGVANDLPGF